MNGSAAWRFAGSLIRVVLLGGPWWGFITPCQSATPPSDRAKEFLDEAPKGWAFLRDWSQHIEGSAVALTFPIEGTWDQITASSRLVFRFAFSGTSSLVSRGTPEKKTSASRNADYEKLVCINPSYSFVLERHSNTAPYLLKDVARGNREDMTRAIELRKASFVSPYSVSPSLTWDDLVHRKGFHLKSVAHVGNSELVRVEFGYAPSNTEYPPLIGGWCVFDRNENWRIQEAEYALREMRTGMTVYVNCKLEYSSQVGTGVPLRAERITYSDRNHKVTSRKACEILDLKVSHKSDAEFKLAAFGLPEIDMPTGGFRLFRLDLWLLGLGVACVVVAVLLRYFQHRRRLVA